MYTMTVLKIFGSFDNHTAYLKMLYKFYFKEFKLFSVDKVDDISIKPLSKVSPFVCFAFSTTKIMLGNFILDH